MPLTMTCNSDTFVLAMAPLGGTTEIEMILSVSRRPRLAKASTVVIVVCCCCQQFRRQNMLSIRIISICVASPKVAKASYSSDCRVSLLPTISQTKYAIH